MSSRRLARSSSLYRKAFIVTIAVLILSLFLLVRSTSIANQAQAVITSAVQNLQVDPWGRVVDVTLNNPVSLSFPDDNTRFEIDLVRPLGRDVNFGVGDVNGDGIADLFGRSFDGISFFYPGLDSHPFRFGKAQLVSKLSWDECPYAESGEGAVWEGVAIADFDGDGVKDVVLGHKIYSLVTANDPTLMEEVYTLEVDHTLDLFPSAGDLDGDDKPDIIMTAGAVSQNTYLHRNQSSPGNFSFQRELLTDHYRPDTSFIGTRGLAVADINNDGLHDLACFHGVYFNQGTTTNPVFDFDNPTAYTVTDGPWVDGVHSDQAISIFMFDGDGDGLVDAYVSNYGTSVWQGSFYKNAGTPSSPSFEFQSPILCQSTPYDNSYRGDDEPSFSPRDIYVSTGDVNRDGLLDILVSDGSGIFSESTVLWNRSTGDNEPHFSCMDIYTFFTDGYPDINPYSSFTQNWLTNVVLAWKDYTGDGLEDIVKTDAFMQAFNLYLLERQTDYPIRFYSERPLTTVTGTGMNGIGLAEFDMDNDGSNDFVFGLSNGQLAYHRNLGTNHGLIFDDQVLLTDLADTPIDIGENSWPVEFDWDGDGDLDLLVGAQSGKISILVNQNGRFTDSGYLGGEEWDPLDLAPGIFGGGVLSPSLDSADLNNDQLIDILGGGQSPPCIWHFKNIGTANLPSFNAHVISVDRTIPGYVEKLSDYSYRLYFGIPVLPEETSVFFYGDRAENQPAVRLISTMPNTVLISGSVSTSDVAGLVEIQAAGLSGVVMDGLPGNPSTDASGNYTATADYGFSGTVTPTLAGYSFSPPSRDYTNVTSDQQDHNYTASIIQCTLTLAVGTGGTTNPTPGSYPHDYGTQVQVTAEPSSGYQFSGWTGDASGTTSPITITMDADKSITANFTALPAGDTGDGDSGGKKGGCFIATAAYGSPLHPHLDILRDFRDKYLMPSRFGRKLVELYYRYSPSIANFIAKHRLLKVAVRINLLPVIAFSYSILHLGRAVTGLLLISIAVVPIFCLVISKKVLA